MYLPFLVLSQNCTWHWWGLDDIYLMISCLVSLCHALSHSWLWITDPSSLGIGDIMPCFMISCHVLWCFMMSCFPLFPLFGNLFHCLFEDPLFMILNDWSLGYMTIPFICCWLGNYFRLQVVHIDHHGFCMVNGLNFCSFDSLINRSIQIIIVRRHPSEPISMTKLYIPPHCQWLHCYPITYSMTYSVIPWHTPSLYDTFHHCSVLPLFSLLLLFYVYNSRPTLAEVLSYSLRTSC